MNQENTQNTINDTQRNDMTALSQFRHFYFGSLLYALFFTFCLYRNFNGITYPFFVGGTLCFFFSCLKKLGITAKKDMPFYVISLLLLGISTFSTNSFPIIFMNVIAVFLLFFILAIHCFYNDQNWSFGKHISAILIVCFSSLLCIDRPFRDMAWYRKSRSSKTSHKKLNAIILGIVISIPLLIIIIMLLYGADSIFASFFDTFFYGLRYIPDDTVGIAFYFLFAFFAYYCIWVYLCKRDMIEEVTDKRTAEPIIAITFTGILSAVYLVFCIIQIWYLFLGNLPLTEGFSYSQYARNGFFQLLFVCLINLILVLSCLGRFRENKVLKAILTVITICTYIMIVSSVMRMRLYIAFYNLTFLRLLVLWALLIITLLITGVLVSIYKPKFPLFRYSIITVTVLYLLFSLSHPDYWIARYNTEPRTYLLRNENQAIKPIIDYEYLSRLSSDAAPVLLADKNAFTGNTEENDLSLAEYRSAYIREIKDDVNKRGNDFRTFNLSLFIASWLLPQN